MTLRSVGVVGAGVMGQGIARGLLDAGFEVALCDKDRHKAGSVPGARSVSDVHGLVDTVDVIVSCVSDPASALSITLGSPTGESEGLLGSLGPQQSYLECTTMSMAAIRRQAEAFADRGLVLIEAPLSGRPPHATALLGGESAAAQQIDHVMAAFAARRYYLGQHGTATTVKLVNQFLTYANIVLAGHGLAVARGLGVEPSLAAEALRACAGHSRSLDLLDSILRQPDQSFGTVASIHHDLVHFSELPQGHTRASRLLDHVLEMFGAEVELDPQQPWTVILERLGLFPDAADHVHGTTPPSPSSPGRSTAP